MTRPSATAWLIASLSLAACARSASTTPRRTDQTRLTSGEFGRAHSYNTLHVDTPFKLANQGVSGTALLLRYMQAAQGSGALYVSNLQIALQMRHNGTAIECVSKIVLEDGSARPADVVDATPNTSGETEYETTVKPWRPDAADAWVIDTDMVCKPAAEQVLTNVPRFNTTSDAEIKRLTDPNEMYSNDGVYARYHTDVIVHFDRCTSTPARRFVHRYEHYLATRFTPPDLEQLRRRYADWKLTEGPPVCHEIRVPIGQHLRQHIEGDIHYPGPYHGAFEDNLTPREALITPARS